MGKGHLILKSRAHTEEFAMSRTCDGKSWKFSAGEIPELIYVLYLSVWVLCVEQTVEDFREII